MYEHAREHIIACMLLEAGRSVSWIKFGTPDEHITYYHTIYGREYLIAWDWSGPSADVGFYPLSKEKEVFVSDIIPIPPECNVWIGVRMVYRKDYL